MATQISRRAPFISSGVSYIAIEVTSGAIEIYGFYSDGAEKFLGYITDLNISGAIRMRATQALYSGGAETIRPVQLSLSPDLSADLAA